MAEEDEGGREDRLLMVGHDEVVAVVFPDQVRNGLHLQIHIAGKTQESRDDEAVVEDTTTTTTKQEGTHLKKAMRRLTISIYCTKR